MISTLILCKASSFTVVERIPEMDEIKLGMCVQAGSLAKTHDSHI